jgi:hypothetical protein
MINKVQLINLTKLDILEIVEMKVYIISKIKQHNI